MALIVNYNDVIMAERHSVVTIVQKSVTLYTTLEFGITLSNFIFGRNFFCFTSEIIMLELLDF